MPAYDYPRIPDEEYAKAEGQAMLAFNRMMHILFLNGLDAEKQMASVGFKEILVSYGQRVRGRDVPITLPGWIEGLGR